MVIRAAVVLVLSLVPFLGGCALVPDPRPAERLVIASWNVQNLFDEVDDGDEYPEFDPGQGWTRAQFWARCSALAKVIRTLGSGGPDILVLVEVEGSHTLEVLRTRFLSDLGYRHWFLAPDSVPGVKTVVLSRYPLTRTGLHYPPSDGEVPLRPLVEVELDLGGRPLVILGNHWKSRIPTPASTEALRRSAATLLSRRIADLEARDDAPLVVAVGDFNTALELSGGDEPALVRGTREGTAPSGGLAVFSRRSLAEATSWPGAVWDAWESVSSPAGSFVFRGDWDRLDHAFVAGSSLRHTDWTVGGFQVVAYAPQPQAYSARTPSGVSDHFPLVLTLIRPAGSPILP